jgi:FtsH-binding integral membrane protein
MIIDNEDPMETGNQMANPNFGTFKRPGTIADQASFDVGLRNHMVRVYNYMASGLALSGIVAFGLFSSAELASLFFQAQAGRVVGLNILGWIAIFAPLGLLLLTSFRAAQMSVGAVQAVYWAVTALMGVSLSLLLFRYTGASVARTFFVTAAAFGALSLYGYTTKRDLTAVGKVLLMGVIGLILASLVNMIWPSGTMSFISISATARKVRAGSCLAATARSALNVATERRAAARGIGVHPHRCQPPWEWRALQRAER